MVGHYPPPRPPQIICMGGVVVGGALPTFIVGRVRGVPSEPIAGEPFKGGLLEGGHSTSKNWVPWPPSVPPSPPPYKNVGHCLSPLSLPIHFCFNFYSKKLPHVFSFIDSNGVSSFFTLINNCPILVLKLYLFSSLFFVINSPECGRKILCPRNLFKSNQMIKFWSHLFFSYF